ncbi:hypothetical protein SU69_04145 [Thermosipho melanesiensis]|uniref:Tetratricopeptide TPR_2 repeat protein n=2 Tax=Thermosipho melanesiensis TaxID=46541 RepID=A6LL72_THEM4|nr:hypothetical protein [Thermosipho melanesiensis]ABR30673.1 hypothetical protein Tmel_0812 [Thermosipho melanesiensis BI429]APT73805.1 hypothetical protein BW47_04375 [Thermosipho melanesiensis]OOC35744.1 hypothetical protein SU68_04200 [Thermosipho melanesiensis]OOC39043.1 hypothetical protein SU69_04145 [Thermosipho melanesiensis]OOC39191.1 hypothetical protein SU70_04145 [Thermosipho melanesiensis]
MKKFIVFFLILTISSFAILTEEQSRAFLSEAIKLWSIGDFQAASKKMEDAITGSISAREIPWFWYFKAKVDIYNDNVNEAKENLETLLTFTNFDVIRELYDKIQTFNQPEDIEVKKYNFKFVESYTGKNGLTEYFYSPVGIAILGDKIFVIDKENKRLIEYTKGKMTYIEKLAYTPKSIAVDSFGNVYISSENSIYKNNEMIYSDLRSPIIAGIDRSGRLIVVDATKIYIFGSEKIEKMLPIPTVTIDCDINYENLYILDAYSNKIIVYDLFTLNKKDEIPLKTKIWSFEVTPAGELIYFDGKNIFVGNVTFEINSFPMFIEYFYPHLFVIDWKENKINRYILKDDLPIFVKIEKFETSDATLTLNVSVEDFFGNDIYLASDFLNLYEEDVREYIDIKGYVQTKDATNVSSNNILTDRFLGKIVYGSKSWKYTGGSMNAFKEKGKYIWKITYNYAKIFPIPLVRVAVKFEILNEKYSDIILYTEEIVGGKTSKGD